jgi:hypothetical protein
MICRVVYILIMCHLSELGDAVKFLFVKKKTKKEKKFLLYFAIRRRNEGASHMVSEPVRPATWGSLRLSLT